MLFFKAAKDSDVENSKVKTKYQNDNITRPFIMRYHGVIDSLDTKSTGNELDTADISP